MDFHESLSSDSSDSSYSAHVSWSDVKSSPLLNLCFSSGCSSHIWGFFPLTLLLNLPSDGPGEGGRVRHNRNKNHIYGFGSAAARGPLPACKRKPHLLFMEGHQLGGL